MKKAFFNPCKILFLTGMAVLMLISHPTMAQRDTSAPQTVTIISEFKPEIKPPAKINLSGAALPPDTGKLVRPYRVPVQNLIYAYQPVSLAPITYSQDSNESQGAHYLAKAGFGNLRTPYFSGAARWGESGDPLLANVYTSYISSKGKVKNQDYSLLDLKAKASYFLDDYEAYAGVNFSRHQFYQYGYNHTLNDFAKQDINQLFNELNLSVGGRNIAKNAWGLDFNPNIAVSIFAKKDSLTENTLHVNLPVEKSITDKISAKVEVDLDNTRYHTLGYYQGDFAIKNNVFRFHPSAKYTGKSFRLNIGAQAIKSFLTWNWLPDITAELPVPKTKFIAQLGWVGTVQKNTIRNLSAINPYINTLPYQFNTLEKELYGGVKTTIGKHASFSCKASFIQYKDFQFFINDTSVTNGGRGFLTSNEPNLYNFRIHGDVSYFLQDKFILTGSVNINAYTGMKANLHAWHTVPVECNVNVKWHLNPKLLIRSNFYFFGGGHYIETGNISGTYNGGADWSLGADYKINSRFGAFIDVNNIFGKKYERWHNYPVYGINALAGVSFRF